MVSGTTLSNVVTVPLLPAPAPDCHNPTHFTPHASDSYARPTLRATHKRASVATGLAGPAASTTMGVKTSHTGNSGALPTHPLLCFRHNLQQSTTHTKAPHKQRNAPPYTTPSTMCNNMTRTPLGACTTGSTARLAAGVRTGWEHTLAWWREELQSNAHLLPAPDSTPTQAD